MELTPVQDFEAEAARLQADGYTLTRFEDPGCENGVLVIARRAPTADEPPQGPIIDWAQKLGLTANGRVILIVREGGELLRSSSIVGLGIPAGTLSADDQEAED